MKLAYVAGPYRDPRGHWYVTKNIEAARAVAIELWRMGYAVICPHSNTAHFDGAAPDHVWLDGDLEMLGRCDLMVLQGEWRDSAGCALEYEVASTLRIPVYLWPDVPPPIDFLETLPYIGQGEKPK